MLFCHGLGGHLIFVLGVCAVGLLVASAVSYDWFITNKDTANQIRDGLWRSCKKMNNVEKCSVHNDVLQFVADRRDEDVLVVIDVVAVLFTIVGMLITVCGLSKRNAFSPSKCLEGCACIFFFIAAFCAMFMVIYTEVEMIKDSVFERGWAVYTLYGSLGALVLTLLDSVIFTICCYEKDLEGFDKSDSLVLRTQRPSTYDRKYPPTNSHYSNGVDNNSYN